MESPSSPPDLDDTGERQAALRRYHVLDTSPEKAFDRITSMIAKICDVPTALISLIDKERQWFKSCFGFDQRQTDLDVSFCVYAVDAGDMLVVEDATNDPRFKDNPVVAGPPHVRFYAGAPLTTPDGIHIGTLCIIDYEPRTFDAAQRELLEDLADTVISQFELRSTEAQIRQLVEENPQPMYVYAQDDGALLDANAAACALYGYKASALSDLTATDLEAPASVQPSTSSPSVHEQADGTHIPVRLRERDVLYDGRRARLAVPQRLPADADTTAFAQVDGEGVVQSMSAGWADIADRPPADAVGTPLSSLVVPGDADAVETALAGLGAGTQSTLRLATAVRTGSGQRPVLLKGQPVRDGTGAVAGLPVTLTPGVEPEESAPSDPAPEAHYDAFSSKLPTFYDPNEDDLSTDGGSAPVAPTDASPESAPEASPTVSPSPFDLTERLRALVAERADAPAHQHLEVAPTLPDAAVPVRLDPAVVEEIVGRLLDNAFAHTEEGFVSLRMEADDDTARIAVVDSGTGVEERFMHVYMNASDGSPSPLERGHELVNRIGGSLSMEEAEEGTRVQLILPRSVASNGADAPND